MHPDAHLLRRGSRSPEQILSHVPNAEGFLAAAVITQAFWDTGWFTSSSAPHAGTVVDREQARMFLLATHGEWAAAREAWCTAADLCPDWLRDIALKVSKQRNPAVDRRKSAGRQPYALPDDTVERIRERVEYLRSKGLDVRTASPTDVAQVLNAAGLTTATGLQYTAIIACDLRRMFARCVEWGKL
jgi:hypothetical protein